MGHSTTSWLNHIICTYNVNKVMTELCIHDKSPHSDHLAMSCHIKCNLTSRNKQVKPIEKSKCACGFNLAKAILIHIKSPFVIILKTYLYL